MKFQSNLHTHTHFCTLQAAPFADEEGTAPLADAKDTKPMVVNETYYSVMGGQTHVPQLVPFADVVEEKVVLMN